MLLYNFQQFSAYAYIKIPYTFKLLTILEFLIS